MKIWFPFPASVFFTLAVFLFLPPSFSHPSPPPVSPSSPSLLFALSWISRNYLKNNNSSQYLSSVICRPSLSQLAPYLSLHCHVCFNLTKGGRGERSVLGITGTSNLISVIYCVQKPDMGWQRDIDERRLMSEEITVRRICPPHPPLSSSWISSDLPPLHVKGIPQLTGDKCSSLMIHCCFAGCIYFILLNKNRNRGMRFHHSFAFALSIKSKVILSVSSARSRQWY